VGKRGERTVATTFPDLLIIVTVSIRGMLAVLIRVLVLEGQLRWVYGVRSWNSFAENAVSREGFRKVFAANTTKAKSSKNQISVDNLLQCLCSSVLRAKRRGEDMKRRR
jgi:hypothetical protein